ncbi:Spy/CpxP family protein refolding chaperone [Methylocapsa palsarum]|nr:Spy/CpxP family protein refolding chaperone [Methylocapsa palsarum]
MKMPVLAGALAALVLSPCLSNATFAGPADPPEKTEARSARFSADEFAAYSDMRIAALKSGLELNTAQGKKWPALEAALREEARSHAERAAQAHEKAETSPENRNPIERLLDRARKLEAQSAELAVIAGEFEKLADAAGPLYDSLDEAQKRKFEPLLRKHVGLPDRRYVEPQREAQKPQ